MKKYTEGGNAANISPLEVGLISLDFLNFFINGTFASRPKYAYISNSTLTFFKTSSRGGDANHFTPVISLQNDW